MPTKPASLHLPVFQKFDCHSCGYCCRNLVVNVTKAERRKIVDAGWVERMPGEALFIPYRFRGRKLQRLAHKPDGACVFLGEDGLCRLHKETGVEIKPLPCRMYPFVPTPGAGSVRVDLRADCPSVAGNHGRSLAVHGREIAGFIEETHTRPMFSRPEWRGGRQLANEEFDVLATVFAKLLSRSALPIRHRLRAGGKLLDLLYSIQIRKVRDERLVELLHVLSEAAVEEVRQGDAGPGPSPGSPSGEARAENGRHGGRPLQEHESLPLESMPKLPKRTGRLFRQWLFLHAIADDPADLATGGLLAKYRRSWARYRQARQFASDSGPVPLVRPDWPKTTFEAVAAVGQAQDEHLEPLCRSMQVKLDAHAFCGPGYYGQDVLTGLTALWLLPSLVGWFARLEAVKAGRDPTSQDVGRPCVLTADDVMAGLRRAHHTFGVSPVFARISERLRLHALARPGAVGALLARYGP